MIKLSVVVITYNEEKNIGRCLSSVKDVADDIVIMDSYSTDETERICKKFNARFFQQKFEGYIEQKNFANSQAKYDYILSLDADEALSPELIRSIKEVKNSTDSYGYTTNRLTNYCGKWIKHGGWYPDKKLRLFDRRKAKWTGYLIHEKVEYAEPVQISHLRGDLLHFSFYSISEHVSQANHFTSIGAKKLFMQGEKAGCMKLFLNPCVKFLRDYFVRFGFLDGYYGYIISRISAHATFLKYIKLRELHLDKKFQQE